MKKGEKRPGDERAQSSTRVRFEERHGEKRLGEDTNQPTRRTKVIEPQGEKRKAMETDFEENIRSLQTQAHTLGLKAMDVLDIRGWKASESTEEKMKQKIKDDKPMIIVGGMSGLSFSKLRNLHRFSDIDDKQDKAYLQSVIQHYKSQIEEGRIFLHGDPVGSAAWRTTDMQDLRKTP